ncbi:MAG: cytochrome c [Acidobacteriota bacterium]
MQKTAILGCILVTAALGLASHAAQFGAPDTLEIERGQYLVEEVARCGMCHTPRDQRGGENRSRRLQGGVIWFEPVQRIQDWAYAAPPLAGLPAYTRDEVVRILQTGMTPDGRKLRPPMPPFRLERGEAAAIVAYLKSLRPPVR